MFDPNFSKQFITWLFNFNNNQKKKINFKLFMLYLKTDMLNSMFTLA